jgi:hypothetical protein
MSSVVVHGLLDEITDFLSTNPTPEQILAFRPSEPLQSRALELLELNRKNTMSTSERGEMETYMQMDHFMTLLKAKTRLKLMGQA